MENVDEPKKRGRKKKDLNIVIDTKLVDISLVRTAGKTTVLVDTPLVDVTFTKVAGAKLDVDITANPLGILKFLQSLKKKNAGK